jgi:hypothetical protein
LTLNSGLRAQRLGFAPVWTGLLQESFARISERGRQFNAVEQVLTGALWAVVAVWTRITAA